MLDWLKKTIKIGVRYSHGKILLYRGNPEIANQPSWAVDIREIIAMCFAGAGALALILVHEYEYAMILLTGILGYATGRTVPGGK